MSDFTNKIGEYPVWVEAHTNIETIFVPADKFRQMMAVVEAARKYCHATLTAHGVGVPWSSLDELIDAVNALDKATEVQGQ